MILVDCDGFESREILKACIDGDVVWVIGLLKQPRQ